MAITKDDLRTEVGAVGATGVPDAVLQNCISVSDALLRQFLGTDEVYLSVPTVIIEKAWLSVAVEIFNQRKAPNGVLNQAFSGVDGGPFVQATRISADPMRPARPLLSPWVGGLTT